MLNPMACLVGIPVGILIVLAGCAVHPSESGARQSRDERVRAHFADAGSAVAQKDSLPSRPALPYLMVDEEWLDDGMVRSLWVTAPGQSGSRCFYLDMESAGSASGFGGCGGGVGETVSVGGNAAIMVGDTGTWPATRVRIKAGGVEAIAPVRNHVFLVPEAIVKTGADTYTITLLGSNLSVIAEVTDVRPPASSP